MKDSTPDKLIRQGKFEEAIKVIEANLRRRPRDEYLMKKLGDLYERTGRREDAIRIFSKLGNYYVNNQFIKKAIAIYKKIYHLDPSNPSVGVKLADLYVQVGLKVNARNLYAHLAELLTKQKRNKEAIEVYKKLSKLYPEDIRIKEMLVNLYLNEGMKQEGVSLLLEIAKQFYNKGNVEEAFARVKRAITLQVDSEEALEFAKKLSEMSGSDLFEKFAREALKKTNNPKIKYLLADYYQSLQQLDKARELLEELLESDPENEKLQHKLSEIYLFTGEYDKGFAILSRLAEKKLEEGEDEEALELLNSILKVTPTHEKTLEKVAEIYEKTGRKNSLIMVLSTLAEIYEQTGEEEKLKAALKKLLSLDPDNVAFQEWFARVVGAEEEETAEEFISTHMEEAENYMKLELWVKAEAELEEILVRYPDHWPAKLKLLEVYLRKGDKKGTKRLADTLRMEVLNDPVKLNQLENLLSSFMKEEEVIEAEKSEDSDELMELEEELLEEEEKMLSAEGGETMFDLSLAEKEIIEDLESKGIELEIEEEIKPQQGISEDEEEVLEISLEEEPQKPSVEERAGKKEDSIAPTRGEFDVGALLESSVEEEEISSGEEIDLTKFGMELETIFEEEKKVEEAKEESGVYDLAAAISQELEAMEEIESEEEKKTHEDLEKEMIRKFSSSMSAAVEEDDYQTHFDLGIAYMEMGMYDDAIAEFQISSKAKEKRVESLELMGVCLFEKGLYEEAIETLKRGLKEEGHPPEAYLGLKYNLAKVYAELGNRVKAKQLIEEIKKVDPAYLEKVHKVTESFR